MFTVVLGAFVNNLLRTKVFCRLGVSLTTVVVVNDSAGRLVGLVRLRVGRLVGFFVVLRLVVGGLLVVILGRVVILRIGRVVVVVAVVVVAVVVVLLVVLRGFFVVLKEGVGLIFLVAIDVFPF